MSDPYTPYNPQNLNFPDGMADGPTPSFVAVTPNDSSPLPNGPCRALYVGVSGNISVIPALGPNSVYGTNTPVVIANAPVGYHPLAVGQVMNTGTSATNIVALY